MEILSKNEKETLDFARQFASSLKPKDGQALVIGLYGNLGAGKTTFMKYFAEVLGVGETIQSPTFVIMRRYELRDSSNELRKNLGKARLVSRASNFSHLIHIDAYRLDSADDLLKLGWNEIISDPNNIVCIEWSERVAKIMPAHIVLKFEHGQAENERKISLA